MSAFLGPLVVGIFLGPFGVVGVMWIFARLHLVSAVLTMFLTLPRDAGLARGKQPAGAAGDGAGRVAHRTGPHRHRRAKLVSYQR